MIRVAVLLTLGLVTACGPISPERAYQICSERARNAAGPTGSVGIGVGSGGRVATEIDLTITSDFLRGRDPELVYDECFRQRTGAGPTRPLRL